MFFSREHTFIRNTKMSNQICPYVSTQSDANSVTVINKNVSHRGKYYIIVLKCTRLPLLSDNCTYNTCILFFFFLD